MKSAMFALMAAALIVGSSGCSAINPFYKGGGEAAAGCASCGTGQQQLLGRRGCADGACDVGQQPGPPTGQVAYPYYTVRGPRDFLARNPRSVGR